MFFQILGRFGVMAKTINSQPSTLNQFGGHKAVVRPVPIPNTAVKHSLADGSSPIGSARVGSRQSFKKARRSFSGLLLFKLKPRGMTPKRRKELDVTKLKFIGSAAE
jgi:hypothetical protein